MNFVPIEAPTARVPSPVETIEFFNGALWIVVGYRLKVIADELIEAFAKSFGTLAGFGDNLFVNGKRNVHIHSIRAHVICVNTKGV